MHRLGPLTLTLALMPSCVPPSSGGGYAPQQPSQPPPQLEGSGNWKTTWYWTAGTCGLAGQLDHTVQVTQSDGGYVIQEDDPRAQITGSMNCSTEQCNLLASETASVNGAPANVSVNFTMRPNGSISGSGSVSFTSPSCSQSFSAQGWRS
jgi:hypothetical protein